LSNESDIPMGFVALGKITRTQGTAGAVRLLPFFFPPERLEFAKSRTVYVYDHDDLSSPPLCSSPSRKLSIERFWYHKQFIILEFHEIQSMTEAELLRDRTLYIRQEDLWDLAEGEYFEFELVGMRILSVPDNTIIGEIVAVEDGAAHDYLRVSPPGSHEFLIPFVREFVHEIDREQKVVRVSLPKGLTEL